MADYYKVLGIDRGASDDDIKKAYRKLAHQYHPDKHSGDDKKFKEINEAYQILSNKEKKAQYDKFGRVFSAGDGFSAGGGPSSGWDFQGFADGFGFGFDANNMGDVGDIFDAFFGGLGGRKRKTYQRGSDLELGQEITLEESFTGVQKILKYKTFVACQSCSGLGHFPDDGFKSCAICDGRGEIKETRNTFFGGFAQVKPCKQCHGAGKIPNKSCKDCSGSGRISGQKEISVSIVPGVADGQMIKISKAGEKGVHGAEAGDLYVRLRVRPHPIFKRIGDDLLVKKEISLIDVLSDKKILLDSISGKKLGIGIPHGFNLKDKIVVEGEGMPKLGSYGKGNLLVDIDIRTPKKLSSKAKKLLEDLDKEVE
ncbi:MAG: DnaJ C-terminal domain-containing protein [bacterium]|nr:DnaJ C-terminal domain-containing protein [bacterium]